MPPHVGIFFVAGDKLLTDSTPLSEAGHYRGHLIHERGHDEYWEQLLKMGAVPGEKYEEHPRGRVAHCDVSGKFTLLADVCVLREKKVVNAILSRMNLPPKDTETGTDSHYQCCRCLGHNR